MERSVLDRPSDAAGVGDPLWRGRLHAAAFPLSVVAGMLLVALGPTQQARLAAAVYSLTSALLFGVSALYHRGTWTGRAGEWLRRVDHAGIYLVIAGTYTPFVLLGMDGSARTAAFTAVWAGAGAGALFRLVWLGAPRWLCVGLYLMLGWMAALFIPHLQRGLGLAVLLLVVAGGVIYSLGGVVYALQRPDPSPRRFGFHEVFHAITLVAYAVQFVAVCLVVRAA